MPDPGKSIPAEVKYELMLQGGPWRFKIRDVTFEIAAGSDMAVIVRRVLSAGLIMEEKIVGVIGDEWKGGSIEFMRLRQFLDAGGVIGLNKNLSFK